MEKKLKNIINIILILIMLPIVLAQEAPEKDSIELFWKLSIMDYPEFDNVKFHVEINDNIVDFYCDLALGKNLREATDMIIKTVIVIGNFTSIKKWKSNRLYIKINEEKWAYITTKDCREFAKVAEAGGGEGAVGFLWIVKHLDKWEE